MSTEKFNLILQLYPEEIKLSSKRREIWMHESEKDKLPAYVRSSLSIGYKIASFKYYTNKDGWIIDTATDEKVVRNAKTAGKPNMQTINGQHIWNGSVDRFQRNNLKTFLTEYFGPAIVRQWPEHIFINQPDKYFHFEFIFYTPINLRGFTTVQDIDNHAYPYVKAFTDTLTKIAVIPNDNAQYYRGCYSRYVDIPSENDRRLEVKLHFCKNNERLW